jgi:hypothetical protein
MEEFQQTQQPERPWQGEERRKQADAQYSGEERRKADQQLDDMAKGQQDG